MGAAMQQVKLPFGTAVTAPIFRYHPAITAQAFATMEALFGNRVMLGIGTGEAMNEVPLGFPWPKYAERRDRLIESVKMMKALWKGGFVDFDGKYYKLKAANLYMKADVPIMMSAMGPKMSKDRRRVRGRDNHVGEDPAVHQRGHLPERRRGGEEVRTDPGRPPEGRRDRRRPTTRTTTGRSRR